MEHPVPTPSKKPGAPTPGVPSNHGEQTNEDRRPSNG